MALDLKVRQASSLSLNGIRQAGSLSYLRDSPKSSGIGRKALGTESFDRQRRRQIVREQGVRFYSNALRLVRRLGILETE